MKSRRACAIPFFFPLYVFSGLPLSVYRCCMLHRSVLLERLEKKRRRKKKRQKKITRCVYPIWREKKEENDFFLLLNRKKVGLEKEGVGGREREREAAARRVH
jgi:hypothetical protein